MRKLVLTFVTLSVLVFTSCSDDDKNTPVLAPVEAKSVTNIHAPVTGGQGQSESGAFTKFSFKTGGVVTGDNWDIAFRATKILVNGGTKIDGITDQPSRTGNASIAMVINEFNSVTTVPAETEFKQDSASAYGLPLGSGKGWYIYTGSPSHLINPIAGRVFVIKTIDGNYAKVEFISYYKDAVPARDSSRYYSFNYVYNPNVGEKSFK